MDAYDRLIRDLEKEENDESAENRLLDYVERVATGIRFTRRHYESWLKLNKTKQSETDYHTQLHIRIGYELRSARWRSHLTQGELAQKANLSVRTIGRVEAGRYNITLRVLFAYAYYCGCNVELIFT